ncbi:MAG: TIR domain-containing protein [Cyanobacteria bacterium P01_F01_bin.53]
MSNNQPDSYEYDVFISYSTADKDWVRGELLTRLQNAGLKVCIDFRNFRPGAATITEIERAIKASARTLLILTPAYLESNWTEFEGLLLQTFDPTNKKLRLLPLLKEQCELPSRLKIFTYLDFAEPDDPIFAWTQLLTALGKQPETTTAQAYMPRQWLLAHPYGMPPNFTGRVAERQMLSDWLTGDSQHPLFVLKALGGFGKSALTWHWLTHDVSERDWPAVVWWSFYEAQAGFDNFLRVTLKYLMGQEPKDLNPREQVDKLLEYLQQPGVLLILDGFERELRAYSSMGAAYQGDGEAQIADAGRDCVNLFAEAFFRGLCSLPNLRGRVLMSTRLRPRPVEVTGGMLLAGCTEKELTQMQPADAVNFFRAQGIRGNRNEIEQACSAYGFHPLSLRLLAGLVVKDFYNPGDIQATNTLDVTGNLVQRQHHVLEQSYLNLLPSRRRLLSLIACFRSPVAIRVIEKIEQTAEQTASEQEDNIEPSSQQSTTRATEVTRALQEDLRDLIARGLVQREGSRFDLHPIVRRYAYDRMTAQTRSSTHGQLRDYFAAVPAVEKVTTIDDLAPTIELYHHMVRAGQYDEARELLGTQLIPTPLYFQLGAYQLCIELLRALFPKGETQPPKLQRERAKAWTLQSLANSYSVSGQPAKAIRLFEQHNAIEHNAISGGTGDKKELAIGLDNLANMAQIYIGALQAAETNLRQSIALCQEREKEFHETVSYVHLGRLLIHRGEWAGATVALDRSLTLFEKDNRIQEQQKVWAYRALQSLMTARAEDVKEMQHDRIKTALTAAARSLELAEEYGRTYYPLQRDYVQAHWLLGTAHRLQPNLTDSDHHLTEALRRCRAINLVEFEANILLDLARLRRDQGNPTEALRLTTEARTIAERCGYVLQSADIHLFLAEHALAEGDRAKAKEHASEALRLATCDGGDYTYKVAYDEAQAMLEQL